MKKKLAIFMAALCIICAGAAGMKLTTSASTASIDITAQAQTVEKEQKVEVLIEVSSDVSIGYINSLITYDDTVLEYVTDTNDATAGASGTINILDTFPTGTYTASYVLKFKALEVGECKIAIDETVIEEFETTNVMEANASFAMITVETNDSVTDEARLSDLLIAPAHVEETFASDLYEYHATVGVETDQLILSAIPMDSQAVVTIEQPEKLIIGENKVVVTVTALSGDYSEYVVYVTKLNTSLPELDDAASETTEVLETEVLESESTEVESVETETANE